MAWNLFEAPDYYAGLLGEEATQKLQNKALGTGLINAALAFAAQPRNQRYGSVLPYLGKALIGGYQSGQDVIQSGLRDYETQQKVEQMKAQKEAIAQLPSNLQQAYKAFGSAAIPSIIKSQFPETESYVGKLEPQNFTPESWDAFIKAGGNAQATPLLRAINKPEPKGPTAQQEYEWAGNDPEKLKFLKERWTAGPAYAAQANAPYKETEQAQTEAETAYRYGRPPQSTQIPVTAGGKTYYFKDQTAANAFKKKAGIR